MLGSICISRIENRHERLTKTERWRGGGGRWDVSLSLFVKIKLKIVLRRRPTSHYSRPVQSRPHQSAQIWYLGEVLTEFVCWAQPSPVWEEKCLSLNFNYRLAGSHHDLRPLHSSLSHMKGQGCGDWWGVVGLTESLSLFVFNKTSVNTWLGFIRRRPRPPPQHQPGGFPNILRPGSIVSTSPYWHWHYTRGDNQYYPLSFLWSHTFSNKMAGWLGLN